MHHRALMTLAACASALAACGPQAEQHAAALTPTRTVTAQRVLQSRRFETRDEKLLLAASVAVLQDLGYGIEEARQEFGMVVGSKATPHRIRVQIVVRPAQDRESSIARITFQYGTSAFAQPEVEDPVLYREFFDRLAQSVFLTAHEI